MIADEKIPHDVEANNGQNDNQACLSESNKDSVTAESSEKQEEGQQIPFSIYTTNEKWFIVALTALAGLFRWVPIFLHMDHLLMLSISKSPIAADLLPRTTSSGPSLPQVDRRH
jgi:hypothetical protein